jgi:hypothetical protein
LASTTHSREKVSLLVFIGLAGMSSKACAFTWHWTKIVALVFLRLLRSLENIGGSLIGKFSFKKVYAIGDTLANL